MALMYQVTTLSPVLIGCPRSSASRVAVRRKWNTGVAQRRIVRMAGQVDLHHGLRGKAIDVVACVEAQVVGRHMNIVHVKQ